ncbi:MAG: hypothetical protein PVH45_01805, partial [Candidatus Omnitrophota bacterium]
MGPYPGWERERVEKMNGYRKKHRKLIRLTAMAVVCLFFVNSIAWADITVDKTTLAVRSHLSETEFREKFLAKTFLIAHDAVNEYIK